MDQEREKAAARRTLVQENRYLRHNLREATDRLKRIAAIATMSLGKKEEMPQARTPEWDKEVLGNIIQICTAKPKMKGPVR